MSDLTGLELNLGEVEASGKFEVLPKGEYVGVVESAELKDTSKGGKMIKLAFRLYGGKGVRKRKIFENLVVVHSSPKVVSISKQKLKSLAIAGGKEEAEASNLKSTQDLVGLEVTLGLKVESSEEYGDQNRVSYFKRYDSDLAEKTIDDATSETEETGL